jgi:hypothetical protein
LTVRVGYVFLAENDIGPVGRRAAAQAWLGVGNVVKAIGNVVGRAVVLVETAAAF